MKNKLYFSILLTTLVSFTFSCKKEGPPGPAGKDGNANVKSSTVTFSNWAWNSSGLYDYADFTWGEITSDVANNGAVLIYVNNGNGGWLPLPRTIYPNNSYSQSQRYVYATGSFSIIVQDSDLTQPINPGTWTIRAVAVAGSVRHANPNLDWDNYEAVKKTLHLAD